jgi:hypothetical protein
LTQVAAAIFNHPCFEVQLLLLQPQQLQLLLLQQRLLLFKILRAWCPVVVNLLAARKRRGGSNVARHGRMGFACSSGSALHAGVLDRLLQLFDAVAKFADERRLGPAAGGGRFGYRKAARCCKVRDASCRAASASRFKLAAGDG